MARDLGLLLDTPVELKELRRPTSGEFSLSQAITMQQLADAYWLWKEKGDGSAITSFTQSKICLQIYQELWSKTVQQQHFLMVHLYSRPGVVEIAEDLGVGSEVLIVTLKGEAVAIAKMTQPSKVIPSMTQGEVAKPNCVLMKEDTYPRSWKK